MGADTGAECRSLTSSCLAEMGHLAESCLLFWLQNFLCAHDPGASSGLDHACSLIRERKVSIPVCK